MPKLKAARSEIRDVIWVGDWPMADYEANHQNPATKIRPHEPYQKFDFHETFLSKEFSRSPCQVAHLAR